MAVLKEIEDFYRRLGTGQVTKKEIKRGGLDGNLPEKEIKKLKGEMRKIFEERNKMTEFYISYFTRKAKERKTFVRDYWEKGG